MSREDSPFRKPATAGFLGTYNNADTFIILEQTQLYEI